LLVTALINVKQ